MDPFLTDHARRFLNDQMKDDSDRVPAARRVWAPKGLTFRRADGEEFPVEASVSGLVARRRRFYTLILRDIHDKEQAEQRLKELQRQNIYLQQEIRTGYDADEFVGSSPAIARGLEQIRMRRRTFVVSLLSATFRYRTSTRSGLFGASSLRCAAAY